MSAAAASVVALAAAPALAATTWTVKPGGSLTATAGKTTITDVTDSGLSVPCKSSVIKGSLKKGSGLSGSGLGTVTSIAFNNCAISTFNVSLKITGKMPLNGISYNKTTKIASMTISKIHGTFSVSAIGCTATVDGTGATKNNGMVSATFSNKTNTLTVLTTGGNLHLYNVSSGCSTGGVKNKDAVNWTGAYKFKTATTITSP